MPTYDFKCTYSGCKNSFEARMPILEYETLERKPVGNDIYVTVKPCTYCGNEAERAVSRVAFHTGSSQSNSTRNSPLSWDDMGRAIGGAAKLTKLGEALKEYEITSAQN